LIKENVSVILGEQEIDEKILGEIKTLILSEKQIIKIDRLNVLKFGYLCSITCELVMNGDLSLREVHQIVDDIENKIKKINSRYKYITIHVNPN